jgi:hypothetical protein
MALTNFDSASLPVLERLLLVGFLVHVVIGYTLYFVALAQPEPPAWAIGYIELLKPTVKRLETAAQLSDRPFPAQVMILYSAVSTVMLTVYSVYCAFFVKHERREFYRRYCEGLQQPGATPNQWLKGAVAGVGLLIAVGFIWPSVLLFMRMSYFNYQVVALFSSSIGSATVLLLSSGLMALICVIGIWCIYWSICSFKSRTSMSS